MADAERILRLELDETHPDFVKILSRKSAIISAVLSATVRVTAERLRGKPKDGLDAVIRAMREHEARLELLG